MANTSNSIQSSKVLLQTNHVQNSNKNESEISHPNINEMISSLNHQITDIQQCKQQMAIVHNNGIFSSSPSPRSTVIAPPTLIAAYNQLFAVSKQQNIATHSPSTYYDELKFEDECEYDSDTLNEYDNNYEQIGDDYDDISSFIPTDNESKCGVDNNGDGSGLNKANCVELEHSEVNIGSDIEKEVSDDNTLQAKEKNPCNIQ